MNVLPFCDPLPDPRCVAAYRGGPGRPGFGDGARNRGARCDRVPYTKPGVGYVMLDGHREPVGVRTATSPDWAIGRITPAYPSSYGHSLPLR